MLIEHPISQNPPVCGRRSSKIYFVLTIYNTLLFTILCYNTITRKWDAFIYFLYEFFPPHTLHIFWTLNQCIIVIQLIGVKKLSFQFVLIKFQTCSFTKFSFIKLFLSVWCKFLMLRWKYYHISTNTVNNIFSLLFFLYLTWLINKIWKVIFYIKCDLSMSYIILKLLVFIP